MMKYGVLVHKTTKNIGDDIQSYAASLFLPSIDYLVDRDTIDTFESKNNEKVAVIMSGWWGWKKWNWPPSNVIVPKLTGMHIMDYGVREWGIPIYDEHLNGIGGEYFKSFGPIGCRDYHTLKLLKKHEIDSYFSGCITLTLPKMPIKKSNKKYVCLVDVNNDVVEKVKNICGSKNIEVKVMTHSLKPGREKMSWDKRSKEVEKLLTVYQNAECVITSRLHVMLPCLAMEVPVLCIKENINRSRFTPYDNWCECLTTDNFLNNDVDIFNIKCNFKKVKETRNKMIKSIDDFISNVKSDKIKNDFKYDEIDKLKWQNDIMKYTLDKWHVESRNLLDDYNKMAFRCDYLEKELWEANDQLRLINNSRIWRLLEKLRKIKRKFIKK